MEKKSLVLTVKDATMFTDNESRTKLGFKFNEKFDARKADKTTGEFVITTNNELSFTKKQFVFNLQESFIISLMSKNLKFERILPIQLIGIFKDAKLKVDRTRLEEGDTFIDIDGNEQTADETMFLTELKDIEFTEKNILAIKSAINGQAKDEDKEQVAQMLDILL